LEELHAIHSCSFEERLTIIAGKRDVVLVAVHQAETDSSTTLQLFGP
jgi:hypothetical protein